MARGVPRPLPGSLRGEFVHNDLWATVNNPDVWPSAPLHWGIFTNDFWGKGMAENTSHKSCQPLRVLTFKCTPLFTPPGSHVLARLIWAPGARQEALAGEFPRSFPSFPEVSALYGVGFLWTDLAVGRRSCHRTSLPPAPLGEQDNESYTVGPRGVV
ncbi:hypothetical protein P7K49_019441 [Saguinus oedipus]|uniref:Uncharacterized protein n=1 Tax=Saguinus oedipus TaxID=9490 RepID=A0ABQ9UYF8_SAGOE|nr:hypothetical protein P7K49_019441 [Saguinus oedipus]